MGILNVDLNNINIHDALYDEDYLNTITLVGLLVWYIKFEELKALKKITEELIP